MFGMWSFFHKSVRHVHSRVITHLIPSVTPSGDQKSTSTSCCARKAVMSRAVWGVVLDIHKVPFKNVRRPEKNTILYYLCQLLRKTFYCNDCKITEFEMTDAKNSFYCICSNILVDYAMIFGLEQEDGSVITPMVLAHLPHPFGRRSRNKRWDLWLGWCICPWRPRFRSVYSICYHIHTMYNSSAF